MLLSSLAEKILLVAVEHNIQAGEVLPEKAFDLFLKEMQNGV